MSKSLDVNSARRRRSNDDICDGFVIPLKRELAVGVIDAPREAEGDVGLLLLPSSFINIDLRPFGVLGVLLAEIAVELLRLGDVDVTATGELADPDVVCRS